MVAATCSSSWVYQGSMHTISSGTGLQVGVHQLLQVGTLPGSCADHCKMPLPRVAILLVPVKLSQAGHLASHLQHS